MDLEHIQNMIYEIRGYRVMLDFDLAWIYGTETKRLKEAVRRNIRRFPGDFMFEITRTEYNCLRSQIASLETGRGKYSKYLPFAFTEQGVAMLSGVLNSEAAIDTNIKIMRAFVAVRQMIYSPQSKDVKELQDEVRELREYVEAIFKDQNDINEDTQMQLELVNEALARLQANGKNVNTPRRRIGYRMGNEDE